MFESLHFGDSDYLVWVTISSSYHLPYVTKPVQLACVQKKRIAHNQNIKISSQYFYFSKP